MRILAGLFGPPGTPASARWISLMSVDEALRNLNARRIALVSPHTDAYQRKIMDAFERCGWACVAEAHTGLSDNFSYCEVPDEQIAAMIRDVATAKPDAIITFCTNFPAAHLVDPLERELRMPIYDTTSIGVWQALRLAGISTERGDRWGSLFRGGQIA